MVGRDAFRRRSRRIRDGGLTLRRSPPGFALSARIASGRRTRNFCCGSLRGARSGRMVTAERVRTQVAGRDSSSRSPARSPRILHVMRPSRYRARASRHEMVAAAAARLGPCAGGVHSRRRFGTRSGPRGLASPCTCLVRPRRSGSFERGDTGSRDDRARDNRRTG